MDRLIAKWNDTINSGPRSRDNSIDRGKLKQSVNKDKLDGSRVSVNRIPNLS